MSLRRMFAALAAPNIDIALPTPISIWKVSDAVVVSGGVDNIPDSGGVYANNFVASAPALRPTYSGGIATFGSGKGLWVPALQLPAGCKDVTLFIVMSQTSNSGTQAIMELTDNVNNYNTGFFLAASGGMLRSQLKGSAGNSVAGDVALPAVNTWFRGAGTFYKSNPAPETCSYVNSVGGTNIVLNADNVDDFPSGQALYWGGRANSIYPWYGQAKEARLYGKLTPAEFAAVDTYLASLY